MNANFIYCFGNFKLHSSEYTLYQGDKKIRLRPKAFEALLYLIERQVYLVRKSEMLDNLWPGVVVTENTLNKCIDEAQQINLKPSRGTTGI